MMRQGASLGEIGDVLGHRHPDTTRIYARVDLGALRPLALPWPSGGCAMNTLREAVEEYLSMRRHLGFKLHDTERGLLDFVTFMEQRRAPVITQALALAWAQPTTQRATVTMGRATGLRTSLRAISPGDRPTHRGPVPGIAAVSAQAGKAVSVLR